MTLSQEIVCRQGFETHKSKRVPAVKVYIGNGEVELLVATGLGNEAVEIRDTAIEVSRRYNWPYIEIDETKAVGAAFRRRVEEKLKLVSK